VDLNLTESERFFARNHNVNILTLLVTTSDLEVLALVDVAIPTTPGIASDAADTITSAPTHFSISDTYFETIKARATTIFPVPHCDALYPVVAL